MTREEAIDNLESLYNEVYNEDSDGYIYAEAIDIAIEALIDQPQSKWIVCYDVDHSTDIYQCTQCHDVNWYPSNYCPNCGARMEKINEK